MSKQLWLNTSNNSYYLIASEEQLPEGNTTLTHLNGDSQNVDATAILQYQIPPEEAKQWFNQQTETLFRDWCQNWIHISAEEFPANITTDIHRLSQQLGKFITTTPNWDAQNLTNLYGDLEQYLNETTPSGTDTVDPQQIADFIQQFSEQIAPQAINTAPIDFLVAYLHNLRQQLGISTEADQKTRYRQLAKEAIRKKERPAFNFAEHWEAHQASKNIDDTTKNI